MDINKLIKQRGIVVTELFNTDSLGVVTINGKNFKARSSFKYIPENATVSVVDIKNNTLIVSRI